MPSGRLYLKVSSFRPDDSKLNRRSAHHSSSSLSSPEKCRSSSSRSRAILPLRQERHSMAFPNAIFLVAMPWSTSAMAPHEHRTLRLGDSPKNIGIFERAGTSPLPYARSLLNALAPLNESPVSRASRPVKASASCLVLCNPIPPHRRKRACQSICPIPVL